MQAVAVPKPHITPRMSGQVKGDWKRNKINENIHINKYWKHVFKRATRLHDNPSARGGNVLMNTGHFVESLNVLC